MVPTGLIYVKTYLANNVIGFLFNEFHKMGIQKAMDRTRLGMSEIIFNILLNKEKIGFEISKDVIKRKSLNEKYKYVGKLFKYGYLFIENSNNYLFEEK